MIWAGTTQPSAVLVAEVPTPTIVSFGLPGALVSVITWPWLRPCPAPVPARLPEITICPVAAGQCPDDSAMSSTGPPGDERPASVSAGNCTGPWTAGTVAVTVTVASANGPAAAVTPASRPVAASSAAGAFRAFTVTVASAPCCAANAWSNGAFEATSSPAASVEAAAEASRTSPMTSACSRRPASPPRRAVRTALMPRSPWSRGR